MFLGPESSYSGQENEFGNLIYRALKLIGKDSLFYRLLVV